MFKTDTAPVYTLMPGNGHRVGMGMKMLKDHRRAAHGRAHADCGGPQELRMLANLPHVVAHFGCGERGEGDAAQLPDEDAPPHASAAMFLLVRQLPSRSLS